jgi:hypothetical protein
MIKKIGPQLDDDFNISACKVAIDVRAALWHKTINSRKHGIFGQKEA